LTKKGHNFRVEIGSNFWGFGVGGLMGQIGKILVMNQKVFGVLQG
jgi:hypothetical protein